MAERPIRLWVSEEAGEYTVMEASLLATLGLDTEAKLRRIFGEAGRWEEIIIKPPLREAVCEIERQCLVPEEPLGYRYEARLEPQKRAAALIESWTLDRFGPPSESAFRKLPQALAGAVDAEIVARLRPMAAQDRLYWRRVAAMAAAIRSGEPVDFEALPEGIKEYYRWRSGWPLGAACLNAMHAEDAATLMFCLQQEMEAGRAADRAGEVTAAAEATVGMVRQRLGIG